MTAIVKADVSFEAGRIVVRLGGGVLFSFPIAGNRRLEGATPEQLVNVEVDERGMHWPDIDEDLSLAGLLRGDWRSEVMDNPVFEMDDEFFEKEIMAPRRRLWERGGGTLHGVCEYLRRREAERMARRAAGKPPNYQTTKLANGETDLARKGAEGE